MTATIDVGDVWAVSTGNNWAAKLIRFGEQLSGKPHLTNHVVVVHHQSADGHWWGIEGRPGGVGWADLTRYINEKTTVSNAAQPKTIAQRTAVATVMAKLLGTPYDWTGIVADAARDLDLPALWAKNWAGQGSPGHVVCSSVAAYAYGSLGMSHPSLGSERFCQPGDWAAFIGHHGWESK